MTDRTWPDGDFTTYPNIGTYPTEYVRTTQVPVPMEGVLDVMVRAATASELAENRIDDRTEVEYIDEAVLARVHADGVFDALQFMFGLGGPSDALIEVLRAGRSAGDDLPEDAPLGYPIVQRAF